MSLLDELNPTCPRGCGRTMDDCHEAEDGGECEGGELLRENERLKAQLAEAMRHLDEAQHKWQTLEQELADANRDRDGALADYDRVSGELVLWHEAFGADTIRDVNRIVPGACLRCGGLEGTHIKRDCLPSQAVVSEAVAHAVTGVCPPDEMRKKHLSLLETWERQQPVVDSAKAWVAYVHAARTPYRVWADHHDLDLIAAVDALIAAESTADGPEQTDEPKAHAYSSHGWPCCDDAPAEQPRLVAKCGGPGLCTLCKVWANQVHLGFPMVRDGDDGPASSVSAQAEAGQ